MKFVALEDNTPEISEDDGLENMMYEQEENSGIIDQTQSMVNEAVSCKETLDKICEATPEEAVKIATEHLLNRMGFSSSFSLESFGNKDSDFNNRFESSLSIAQEGILQRFGSTIKFAFTSENRMVNQSFAVAAAIKSKGAKQDSIVEPGWGRIFTVAGKNKLNSSDVFSSLNKYKQLITSSDFKTICSDVSDILSSVAIEVQKSRFIADNEAIKNIQETNVKAEVVVKRINEILNVEAVRKYDSTFEPIGVQDAEKLMKQVNEVLEDKTIDNLLKELNNSIDKYNSIVFMNSQMRVMQHNAKDIRAAVGLVNTLNPAINAIFSAIRNKSKVCFSAIQYVKASTA